MEPVIREFFEPEEIMLTLPLEKNASIFPHRNHKSAGVRRKMSSPVDEIVEYLTKNIRATGYELALFMGMNSLQIKNILNKMIMQEIIETQGSGRSKVYKLKE